MKKLGATFVIAVVVSAILLALPTTIAASTIPRLPTSEADWQTFTAAERAAAYTYVAAERQLYLAQGRVDRHRVEGNVLSGAASSSSLIISSCGLEWENYPSGTWTRAYGEAGFWYTVQATYIAAGRVANPAMLIRDGVVKATFYEEDLNPPAYTGAYTVAKPYSSYDFKWWFEHPNYTAKSFNTVQAGSVYWLGPDAMCTVSQTL